MFFTNTSVMFIRRNKDPNKTSKPFYKIKGGKRKTIWHVAPFEHGEYKGEEDDFAYDFSNDEELWPIFNWKDKRKAITIAGPAGAGKSYLAAQIVKDYAQECKKNNIYLFRPSDDDPLWKDVNQKLNRYKDRFFDCSPEDFCREHLDVINNIENNTFGSIDDLLDEGILTEKNDLLFDEEGLPVYESYFDLIKEEYSNSLLIFDDFENLSPKFFKQILEFIHKVLICGRKPNVSIIIILHEIVNTKNQTTSLLKESDFVFTFPNLCSPQELSSHFKRHMMISDSLRKDICRLSSRWVMMSTASPRFALSQNGAINLIADF